MSYDGTQILSRREVHKIVEYLEPKARKYKNMRMTLVVFRLTIGAGLRASEITDLQMRDVRLKSDRPHIHVRNGKGGKPRRIPLWWDRGTLDTMSDWYQTRSEMGAQPTSPFLCSLEVRAFSPAIIRVSKTNKRQSYMGDKLNRVNIWRRWKSAVRCLGPERRGELSTHSGRHTYGSYMVRERSLAEVRDAMGHTNVEATSAYLHITPEELERWSDVFAWKPEDDKPKPVDPHKDLLKSFGLKVTWNHRKAVELLEIYPLEEVLKLLGPHPNSKLAKLLPKIAAQVRSDKEDIPPEPEPEPEPEPPPVLRPGPQPAYRRVTKPYKPFCGSPPSWAKPVP